MSVVELDCTYELTGPSGIRAVFNDQLDPDYVGVISSVSGTDSPDLRETAEDIVQEDGGLHGDFFYGRRPIVLEGLLLNPVDAVDRNNRMDKISGASDAMRGDCTLRWTPSGRETMSLSLRRQNGPRFSGAWQKEFSVGLVAEDPRIYSDAVYTQSVAAGTAGFTPGGRAFPETAPVTYGAGTPAGQLIITNAGNTTSYPKLVIYGPGNFPAITNATTGYTLYFTGSLSASDYLVIDTNPIRRTVLLNNASSAYSRLVFTSSTWWGLVPGNNDIRMTFAAFSTPAAMGIEWRNAYL